MVLLPLHIAGGAVGIVTGFIALHASKGSPLHRRSGTLFVYAMLLMSASAVVLGALHGEHFNLTQGLLTGYLVTTAAWSARRDDGAMTRRRDVAAMLGVVAVAGYQVTLGVQALGSPRGTVDGIPAAVVFIFAAVSLMAAMGDAAMIRRGTEGRRRIARHAWRMCFATFIASGSFFLGQADTIPPALRIFPILGFLAALPLAFMAYWLRRLRKVPMKTALVS